MPQRRFTPLLAALFLLLGPATAGAQDGPGVRTTTPATTPSTDAAAAGQPATRQPATAQPSTTKPGTGQQPIRIVLSYSDQKLKAIDVKGGCIICAVQSVAEAMQQNGLGPETHALMLVEAVPRYDSIAQGVYTVRLRLGSPTLEIDSRIDAATQTKLKSEASRLMVKLQGWNPLLSEREMRALFGYDGKVDIPLSEPFAHVATWAHQVPTVSLKLQVPKPRPILNFVMLDEAGQSEVLYELRPGQAFWVEARFISRPETAGFVADLAWEGGTLQVPLQATDRVLVYRGGPYYVAPPPAPTAPESD